MPQTPAGDIVPCTPLLGLRPKGIKCLWMPFFFGSAYPFGATPQNPARATWRGASFLLEMKLRKRDSILRHLTGFFDKLRRPLQGSRLFDAHVFLVRAQAPRVGFWGVAPNGYTEPKKNGIHKLLNPWGEAPNSGVQGGHPPAGVWGGAPPRPPLYRPSFSHRSASPSGSSVGTSGTMGWFWNNSPVRASSPPMVMASKAPSYRRFTLLQLV